MNKIVLFFLLALFSTTSLGSAKDTQSKKETTKYIARITYYSGDQDKYGSRVAAPSVKRATEGVTVAAHPKFPFGTKVSIPKLKGIVGDGQFVVQDRGTAVTQKKASKGKALVFDVYVSNNSKIRKCAKSAPQYMEVYVVN